MAGTFIVRTGPMNTPTGGFSLVPPTLVPDGATALSNGTVLMPVTANPNIYLDGDSSPTLLASLPAGWTPDDGYIWHHNTYCATGSDTCSYALTALAQTVLVTGPNAGTSIDTSLTGLTLSNLTAFLGATITITAVAPSQVSVQNLINNDGTWDSDLNISLVGTYTTVAPVVPGITSLSPASGPVAGGNTVTVTGTGLTGTTSVRFCGTAATSFTVVSDTKVTAVVPAGTAGDCMVTLGGVGFTATYTYSMAPIRLPPIPRLR